MVKTGQFATKCKGKYHFGKTPPRTLKTLLPAKSSHKSYLTANVTVKVIPALNVTVSRNKWPF